MRRLAAGLAVLLLAAGDAGAFGNGRRGTSAATFLRLGSGARAAGMGEAYTAVVDDATALYWNPGALTRVKSGSASAMRRMLGLGTHYESLALAQNLSAFGGSGALALGYQRLSFPAIGETDPAGFATGASIRPSDQALTAGYAFPGVSLFEDYAFGLGVKHVRSRISSTAGTVAADAGFLSPAYALDSDGLRARLGLTGRNLGGRLRYGQDSEPLPMEVRFGSALEAGEFWTYALDAAFPNDNRPFLAAGLEGRMRYDGEVVNEDPAAGFAGRLGYNTRTAGEGSPMSGLSIGLGFRLRGLEFNYAFLPSVGDGSVHQLSLELRYGGQTARRAEGFYAPDSKPKKRRKQAYDPKLR